MPFPVQDLTCPAPGDCPVPTTLPDVPGALLRAGTAHFRCYETRWGYDEFNPGYGDSRFAPFDAAATGIRVPAMYTAEDEAAALLETVFHEAHHESDRHIYEKDLRERAVVHFTVPRDVWLADLRDGALHSVGLSRDEIVSTSSEHYPCTRRVARELHARRIDGRPVQGVLWHSRQAELRAAPPAEVCVIFGDAFGTRRGAWPPAGPGGRSLFEGPGRLLVDVIAENLGATVHPDA